MRRTASSTTAAEVTETADGSSGRSSARLVAALEALTRAEEGMGLAELSIAVGAPKSSLLGILRSLVRLGYLAHAHGLYRLGPRSFRLAADMLVDPLELEFQLLRRRYIHCAEYAHATRLRYLDNDVSTMRKRQQRKLDPKHVTDGRIH